MEQARKTSHASRALTLAQLLAGVSILGITVGCGGATEQQSASSGAIPDAGNGDAQSAECTTGSPAARTWTIEEIDKFPDTPSEIAMDIDAEGRPQVAYFRALHLIHGARDASAGWKLEKLLLPGGTSPSLLSTDLVIDANGRPHIAYEDLSPLDAEGGEMSPIVHIHERLADGTWHNDAAPPIGSFAWWQGMAMGPDGALHLALANGVGVHSLERSPSGAWTMDRVYDKKSAVGAAIDVDTSGGVHISYNAESFRVQYAVRAPGGTDWQSTDVGEAQFGSNTSIALASGAPHITYGNLGLRHGSSAGGWVPESVGAGGGDVALDSRIAADACGNLHVAYVDAKELKLVYASYAGGEWRTEIVDTYPRPVRVAPVIAVDAGGGVHITYGRAEGSAGEEGFASDIRYAWSPRP